MATTETTPTSPGLTEPTPRTDGDLAHHPDVVAIADLFREFPLTLPTYFAIGVHLQALAARFPIAKWRDAVASRIGKSVASLNKCLQFANTCTPDEAAELADTGAGWGMVSMALAVPDQSRRLDLLRQAVGEKWDQVRLRAAIKETRPGFSRGGGRTRKAPTATGLKADLDTLTRSVTALVERFDATWGQLCDQYLREAGQVARDNRDQLAIRLGALAAGLRDLGVRAADGLRFVDRVRQFNHLPGVLAEGR